MKDFTVRGQRVDISNRTIQPSEIHVQAGLIRDIRPVNDAPDVLLMPGFIDAHIHIESSLLPPSEAARWMMPRGTVAVVNDPHEIANVMGTEGVRYMLEDGAQSPLYFFFGAPSCVPAGPPETTGGILDVEAVATLLEDPAITHLSEVMNYPGVLNGDPEVMAKIAAAQRLGKPVDGHAPGLLGEAAQRYASAGISTDHECTTLEEAETKIAAGMHVLIREGSASRDLKVLAPLVDRHPDQVMLCSDDLHPDDLVLGHIDRRVRTLLQWGYDPFRVLQVACINPIRHYRLPVGQLRIGDPADFIQVDSLQNLKVQRVWIRGHVVAEDGVAKNAQHPVRIVNRFAAEKITDADLHVPATGTRLRVIGATDGTLVTKELFRTPRIVNGGTVADPARDLLKIVVYNRYRPAKPAVGFVEGFGLRQGAIASSVAHDAHNIIAVGASDAALVTAINRIIEHQGGLVVVDEAVHDLPLPIGGLMTDLDGRECATRYASLEAHARRLGSSLRSPLMALSFMALSVIGELKLTDLGLFHTARWSNTDVFETVERPALAQA